MEKVAGPSLTRALAHRVGHHDLVRLAATRLRLASHAAPFPRPYYIRPKLRRKAAPPRSDARAVDGAQAGNQGGVMNR